MRKVLIFFTGVFGFILIFSVSAIISYFMYPEAQQTAADIDDEDAAVNMNYGNTAVGASSELTIITPALDKTKTVITYGSASDVVGDNEDYAEDDTYYEDGGDEEEAAKVENVQSTPQTTIVEQTAASSAVEEEPEAQEDEVEWGIELPPNTTVVTPTLDESERLSDTGL
ncbi:MAG: hypothetical protein LUG52_01555 [Clostridia bacterium]|nr:hypothetical protein [Clostridia bacterium]